MLQFARALSSASLSFSSLPVSSAPCVVSCSTPVNLCPPRCRESKENHKFDISIWHERFRKCGRFVPDFSFKNSIERLVRSAKNVISFPESAMEFQAKVEHEFL